MARKLQKKEKKLLTVLLLIISFNLLSIPMYIAIYFDFSFQPLQHFLASLTTSLLKHLGYTTYQDGPVVITDDFKFIEISWDSTGWKSMYAIFALGLVTPIKTWSKRIKFICLSVPTIFLLNFIRIVTTILISLNFGFQYFEVVHTILWREGMIFAVVLIWGLWVWNEKHNIKVNQYMFR